MKKYDTILFDLDGTLTDPATGLIKSFKYALDKMGVDYGAPETLTRFIGPPLYAEWQRVFNFSDSEVDTALKTFRAYYGEYGWWDNRIYNGIDEMLSKLKASGLTLAVATSKPEIFAKKVLKLFEIDKYFDFVGAADTDRTRDKKYEVIDYVFANLGEEKRKNAILVGDRRYDAEGAAIAGIDSLGVLWGHGSEEEIDGAGFLYKARTPADVVSILLQSI